MKNSAGEATDYSFGWYVGEEQGIRYAAHSGGAIGGRSALLLLPDSKIIVAMAANIEGDQFVNEAFKIATIFKARNQGS